MARRPNYDFEKRRKELDRAAKKAAKQEERARRREEAASAPAEPQPGDPEFVAPDESTGTPPA